MAMSFIDLSRHVDRVGAHAPTQRGCHRSGPLWFASVVCEGCNHFGYGYGPDQESAEQNAAEGLLDMPHLTTTDQGVTRSFIKS